uniref:D-3-phosphoglycerate dehydrogenase n=1 Tax=Strigamia maritima TaxID=126957 RepID=T1JC05_STRMM
MMTHHEKRFRVLITDPISQSCIDILKENNIDVTYKPKLALEEILKEIPEYEILIVRSGTKVTKEVLNVANKLMLVGRAGTGVDNVDMDAATRRGVVVMKQCTRWQHNQCCRTHMCHANGYGQVKQNKQITNKITLDIPQACNSMKLNKWERNLFMGTEIHGKTLAIVGLGRVGRAVAFRMQAFGMKTVGYDPIITAETAKSFGVQLFPLEELWPKADFITLHVPLDAETKHLINDDVFAKCRRGVRIINVARGGIVNEEALLNALVNGNCAGAALDVFAEEPPRNVALIQHIKVICTPHLGANTTEAQLEVSKQIAKQIVEFVNHKALIGVVNGYGVFSVNFWSFSK